MSKEYVTKTFTIREEEFSLLEILAKMQDRSKSAVLRTLIKEEAKKRGLVVKDKKDESPKDRL